MKSSGQHRLLIAARKSADRPLVVVMRAERNNASLSTIQTDYKTTATLFPEL